MTSVTDQPGQTVRASPRCARCGYDLGGLAASWDRACPLGGTCSECGHEFAWSDAFNPSRRTLPGFVEHDPPLIAERRRGPAHAFRLLSTAWRTLGWTISLRLYRRLSVDHVIRPGRIAWWFVLTLGVSHLVAAGLGFVRLAILWGSSPAAGPLGSGPPSAGDWLGLGGSALGYPIIITPRGTFPGGSGVELMIRDWPLAVWLALGTNAMFALLLIILPSARRAVGVRAAHVWRAAAYGMAWVMLLALFRAVRNLALTVQVSAEWFVNPTRVVRGWRSGPSPVRITDFPDEFVIAVLLGWMLSWWLVVLGPGWRVRRAWLVWGILAVPGVLLGIALERWVNLLM